MVQEVVTRGGKTAAVLDVDDWSRAKTWLIRWLLGIFLTAVVSAFSLATYVSNASAKDREQDRDQAAMLEQVKANTVSTRQLDSVRIEMRHIARDVESINQKLDRALR